MCGRFTITAHQDLIQGRFRARFDAPMKPRYNAAPSQETPVVLNSDPEKIQFVRWGLLPEWAKKFDKKDEGLLGSGIKNIGPKSGGGIINVRLETLSQKRTFQEDLKKRRCLVIADGFYEWKQEGRGKVPYRITLKNGGLFAFAGLWEENVIGDGPLCKTKTFAIVTAPANHWMAPIHGRMPVVLAQAREAAWLEPSLDPSAALRLLQTNLTAALAAARVSTRVNDPAHDEESVIRPVEGIS